MLFEATTLAATASAMAQAIESYGVSSDELFAEAGLDKSKLAISGARYPMPSMIRLWKLARDRTGDPCLGLVVTQHMRPTMLHALGFSWLASPSILVGLERLARYFKVVNTAARVEIREQNGVCQLLPIVDLHDTRPTDEAIDAFMAGVVKMCRAMSSEHFAPQLVSLKRKDNGQLDTYVKYFQAPVRFGADEDCLYFDAESLERPVPAGNDELAYENDRIAERYLTTIDASQVGGKVRELLISLLPSGNANEEVVARNLHRSVSSLQRALKAEGVTYKQILDETRRSLAEQYVRQRQYSLSEIAYLLGFSDQSNFSRAFKRWTGQRPTEFRA